MSSPEMSGPRDFSRLDDGITRLLLQDARTYGLRRGESLMRQGDPSAHAFMIESGGLLLFRADKDGGEVALDLLGPGEFCGIEDVLCERPYALSARATTRTACYGIPSDIVRGVIRGNPNAAIAIAGYVAVRLRLAERHMETLALETTTDRIENVLRRLARRIEPHGGSDRRLPLTQADLASLIGVSRQSVNRGLRNLRIRGIVTSHHRHIAVSDTLLS